MIDKDWVCASFCFARYVKPHFISSDIQSLGQVEAILDAWERQFKPTYHNQQRDNYDFNADPQAFLLNQIGAVSRMWILSGYEILRVVYNQLKQNKNTPELTAGFERLFWRFTMVRMETAKYERAKIKDTIGNPTVIIQIDSHGIVRVGWQIYCKKTETVLDITRRDLADELVSTLLSIRKNLPVMG